MGFRSTDNIVEGITEVLPRHSGGKLHNEIDAGSATWTIPAFRMKASKEHRVPLSSRAVEILAKAKNLRSDSAFTFPGFREGKPLSNMVLLMKIRRMNQPFTVHGFRSAFRDWASERTNFAREVCEMALAHTIKSKAEAAYRRGDLLEQRRDLSSPGPFPSPSRPLHWV